MKIKNPELPFGRLIAEIFANKLTEEEIACIKPKFFPQLSNFVFCVNTPSKKGFRFLECFVVRREVQELLDVADYGILANIKEKDKEMIAKSLKYYVSLISE